MSARELMPMDGLKEFTWTIAEKQSELETLNNSGQVLEYGSPKWMARAVFGSMNRAVFQNLDAFISRRRGSLITFTAFRPLLRTPLLNPSQTNSGITIGTVDIGASTVVFGGLSANVKAGDMFSYRTAANGYWIGKAVNDVSLSAGSATVEVWPPPMAKHASAPAPRVFEALGEFKLVGAPQNTEQHIKRGTYSFQCEQYVE